MQEGKIIREPGLSSGCPSLFFSIDSVIKAQIAALSKQYVNIQAISLTELVDGTYEEFDFVINAYFHEDWLQLVQKYMDISDIIIFHISTLTEGLKKEIDAAIEEKKPCVFIVSNLDCKNCSEYYSCYGPVITYKSEWVELRDLDIKPLKDVWFHATINNRNQEQHDLIGREALSVIFASCIE